MLEYYYVKPTTVDRILANVAGAYIEHYVSWLRAQGYADRNVCRRVLILCQFGEFASARGATDGRLRWTTSRPSRITGCRFTVSRAILMSLARRSLMTRVIQSDRCWSWRCMAASGHTMNASRSRLNWKFPDLLATCATTAD
ncbi:hypothetical protein IAG25_39945 [Caballeronia sp. EK]|uniref:hypothetical protein n=1 Tax=Caballeronia sp. EK TaxID=2767469 RepID=UPI001656819E|nr:hypothetical protein [Caballeronia sp. EK]MBC8642940.1 hypothetical protein [Caballeronia sp. EK]